MDYFSVSKTGLKHIDGTIQRGYDDGITPEKSDFRIFWDEYRERQIKKPQNSESKYNKHIMNGNFSTSHSNQYYYYLFQNKTSAKSKMRFTTASLTKVLKAEMNNLGNGLLKKQSDSFFRRIWKRYESIHDINGTVLGSDNNIFKITTNTISSKVRISLKPKS